MKEISEKEFLKLKNIKSPTEFSKGVKVLKSVTNLSWIEAVLEYCEQNDIEEDIAPKLLTGELKSKIFDEAMELHYFPNNGVLPL
tara:strand:+ start:512 stop:766 length:255 start_codon:yes stop_codon:yes gene_type:complete